eukprot:jgi/Bigna1/83624/fgenesh1_pg.111_\
MMAKIQQGISKKIFFVLDLVNSYVDVWRTVHVNHCYEEGAAAWQTAATTHCAAAGKETRNNNIEGISSWFKPSPTEMMMTPNSLVFVPTFIADYCDRQAVVEGTRPLWELRTRLNKADFFKFELIKTQKLCDFEVVIHGNRRGNAGSRCCCNTPDGDSASTQLTVECGFGLHVQVMSQRICQTDFPIVLLQAFLLPSHTTTIGIVKTSYFHENFHLFACYFFQQILASIILAGLFSLIRHVAGGVVLILTIVITTTLLSKLKGMLQNLNTSFGHLAEEEGYPHNVVQINQIKRTLASIILAGFGTLLGLVFFSFQSATSKNRSYSKRIHEEREHYNLYSDLIGYWLVLVAYFFMVYYTWMPMENSSCCSGHFFWFATWSQNTPQNGHQRESFGSFYSIDAERTPTGSGDKWIVVPGSEGFTHDMGNVSDETRGELFSATTYNRSASVHPDFEDIDYSVEG